MIEALPKNIVRFILLVLVQVLILNNLHLSIYINPYVYILIILILPFETPGWLILTAAFLIGLIMDAFSNTMGIHSATIVLLAFLRQYTLKLIAPRDGYESGKSPHYDEMGMPWFLIYAGILTFIHHFFLFLLEDFSFVKFFPIFFKAILSSVLSLTIMIVLLLASYKPRR